MKLLREFFRLRAAGMRTVPGRRAAVPAFQVTVPAPLQRAADDGAVAVDPLRAAASPKTARREPASFLKASRHRRLGAGR
jgi:hypothetical protein